MIREFRKETGNHVIWFYTTERFLYYAKNILGASVKSKTINEVKRPIIDLNSLMSSESGQVSAIAFDIQHGSNTAESDSYGIGQISKMAAPFTERIQFLSNQESLLKNSSILEKIANNVTLKVGQTKIEPTPTVLSAKVLEEPTTCSNINKKEPTDCNDSEAKDEK